MSEPEFWFAWLKLAAFALGLAVGSFAVGSPSWVWLREHILNTHAVLLAFFGTVLMSMSIWTSIRIEGPGFKALFQQIAQLEATLELERAMSDIRFAELETETNVLRPDIYTQETFMEQLVLPRPPIDPSIDTIFVPDVLSEGMPYQPSSRVFINPDLALPGFNVLPLSGEENKLKQLQEFLTAFPVAKAPIKWAEAQIVLGELLMATPITGFGFKTGLKPDALLIDEKPAEKRARLKEAEQAFLAALDVFKRDEQPALWARARIDLALSRYLQTKMQLTSDEQVLKSVLKDYDEAKAVLAEHGDAQSQARLDRLIGAAKTALSNVRGEDEDRG